MRRPDAGVFVIGVKQEADLFVDVAVRALEPVSQQRLFGVVVVLVARAPGGPKITEIA